jgi:Putative porin
VNRPFALLALFLGVAVAVGSAAAQQMDRLSFYGDFRGRVELDRSSRKPGGSMRSDRDRLRVRGRFGLRFRYSDRLQFGGRVRTGDPDSRQSPHVTLGDDFKTIPFALDRLYARVSVGQGSLWFGKNSNPFWHQNELFWDDDVSLDGASGRVVLREGDRVMLEGRAGYFVLDPPQSNSFADQSRMMAGQVVLSGKGGSLSYTAATSLSVIRENAASEDVRLNDLDYQFLSASASVAYSGWTRPLSLGLDLVRNTEDYPVTVFNHDQRSGYVITAQVGSLAKAGDFLARYTWAHIEKYAVVGPFAQDDWVRWGSATTTLSSNFEGHELRVAYAFGPGHNLVARLYRVDGIAPESAAAVSLQTGTRFRLDWNIRF